MAKQVLIVMSGYTETKGAVPPGCWFPELVHPYYLMVGRGLEIDFTCPTDTGPVFSKVDFQDPYQQRMLNDRDLMDRITGAPLPQTLDAEKYNAIFFAGGHGGLYDFPSNPHLISLAETIWARGGVVSAFCHGPAGITELRDPNGEYLVKGRNVTSFSRAEETFYGMTLEVPYVIQNRLEDHGAKYTCYGIDQGYVVRDGRLVTGQNWYSAQLVANSVADALLEG